MLAKNLFYTSFTFMFVAFFITTSIRPSVQIISVLLFLILLIFYFYSKFKKIETFAMSRDEKLLYIAFLLMAFSALPPLLVNDSLSVGYSGLDLPSKYLLFSFIFLLILKTRPIINKTTIFISIGFAGILNGIIALSHIFLFDNFLYGGRVQGFSGINEFGIICGSLCVLNIILFIYNKQYKLFFLIASILSFIGVAGSGLRGVVLAIIFALVIIFIINLFTKIIKFKTACKYFAIIFGAILVFGYLVFNTMENNRLKYTQSEIDKILKGDNSSSIGLRIEMYKEAIAMFRISPIIGLSAKSSLEKADEISRLGNTKRILDEASKGKPLFGKKHNEILNFMAKRGLVGLFSLLFFYFAVLNICAKSFKTNVIGMLGLGLMLVYIGVGFSGDPLTGHPESTFFALTISFFVLLMRQLKDG